MTDYSKADFADLSDDEIKAALAATADSYDLPGEHPPEPLIREIPAGKRYPVEALGPLRAVVETVQQMNQAPVAIAAQSALGASTLAVQAFANVETLGGDRPVSL